LPYITTVFLSSFSVFSVSAAAMNGLGIFADHLRRNPRLHALLRPHGLLRGLLALPGRMSDRER
jgi:hypothetical protein